MKNTSELSKFDIVVGRGGLILSLTNGNAPRKMKINEVNISIILTKIHLIEMNAILSLCMNLLFKVLVKIGFARKVFSGIRSSLI